MLEETGLDAAGRPDHPRHRGGRVSDVLPDRLPVAVPVDRVLRPVLVGDGEGTALRVESEGLEDIRNDLALALHGLLTPQDMAPWRPHVTVQNKVEPKEARALQAQLRSGFERRPLAIRGLALWRYLGGPWEPVRQFAFRG